LEEWAHQIVSNAHSGNLSNGKPIAITGVQAVAGPRAGALDLYAGLDAGQLLKVLSANNSATLRQFVPWEFAGEPQCFMRGRYVRVEAGWSDDLAENLIRLSDVGHYPKDGGRWLAGRNERGQTVTLGLHDGTPQWLFAGQTGSGKSIGMLNAGVQLGKDPRTRLILLDGKYGVDLSKLAHLPTLVGPIATDRDAAHAALIWALDDMKRRYQHRDDDTRLIILWDEPQEWLADSPAIVEMTARILAKGRGAGVHIIMSTQHPVVSVFGDSTSKRNLTGRLALKVADYEASRVAVGGSSPRADHLLGAGDCYAVTPTAVHRIQGLFVDDTDFAALPSGEPQLADWPTFSAEDIGRELEPFTPAQTAEGIIAAHKGEGRPALESRADVGSTVGRRLLNYGRDVHECLSERGYMLCWLVGTANTPTRPKTAG